jgi:F-type H+-transporting ATPase subunit epsilon
MATLHLEIVTAEKTIFAGEVDQVTVPGGGGVMGVLANHAPVLSTLKPGELRIKIGNTVEEYAIGGGFIDINNNKVTILADSAERADEIDASRAEAARKRAEEILRTQPPSDKVDLFKLESAIRRSQVRLNVARKYNPRAGASE